MKSFLKEYFDGHEKDSNARYLTFDICYTYFNSHRGYAASAQNIEKSIFVLWGYLSSWGMLRGRSYLLKKNPFVLGNVIQVIDLHQSLFDVDAPNLLKHEETIIECYNDIKKNLTWNNHQPSITLLTKIMFGVYSCIPAIDTNVSMYFKHISGHHPKSIKSVINITNQCYTRQKYLFSPSKIKTINWHNCTYPRTFNSSRLIDIYAYVEGRKLKQKK